MSNGTTKPNVVTAMVPRTSGPHNIAACFQEMFSLAAHLTNGREIGTPDRFGSDVRALLKPCEVAAKALGYTDGDIDLARFAVVALLDDIIMNSTAGARAGWVNNPLVLQIFQKDGAEVRFFNNLNDLLKRDEDRQTLEVLEVYLLCLLMGFRGHFGAEREEALRAWREPIVEKLHRVFRRGRSAAIQCDWSPDAPMRVQGAGQQWTRRAAGAALAVALMIPVMFMVYSLLLSRGVSTLADLAGH